MLGGEVFGYDVHRRYFRRDIAPRLGRNCRYLGPVGFRQKRRLLTGARCLLAPSLVRETSSLVAMEALACGTPVVAFASGALAEIVEHSGMPPVADWWELWRATGVALLPTCPAKACQCIAGCPMTVSASI